MLSKFVKINGKNYLEISNNFIDFLDLKEGDEVDMSDTIKISNYSQN